MKRPLRSNSALAALFVTGVRRLSGERPLDIQGVPEIGMAVRERGRSRIYSVTRHEPSGGTIKVWGKPTGLYESGGAAEEWAEDQLRSLRKEGKGFTLTDENELINKLMRRFGRGEESAADIVNKARRRLAAV